MQASAVIGRSHAVADARGTGRLRECPECGLFQRLPPLPRGAVARCPRCGAVLRRRRTDPVGRSLALAVTGVLLLVLAFTLPFIDVDVGGQTHATTLLSGPTALEQQGAWELAVAVLVTTLAAPAGRLLALSYVLLSLQRGHPPRHLYMVFRWVEWLSPWSMIEVFLLGVFVAYTRLIALAHVEVGGAVVALGALMLASAAADGVLDHEAVWERLEGRDAVYRARARRPRRAALRLRQLRAGQHRDDRLPALRRRRASPQNRQRRPHLGADGGGGGALHPRQHAAGADADPARPRPPEHDPRRHRGTVRCRHVAARGAGAVRLGAGAGAQALRAVATCWSAPGAARTAGCASAPCCTASSIRSAAGR